jgi:hypothetical protein
MPFLALLLLCAMPHSTHAQYSSPRIRSRTLPSDHCSCQRPWGRRIRAGPPAR